VAVTIRGGWARLEEETMAEAVDVGWRPEEDVAGAELGDRRRTERLAMIVGALSKAPSRSLPEIFTENAELAAFYRFTENESFGWRDILAPHVARTAERATRAKRVLVVHDTTDVTFALRDGHVRKHLGVIASRTQGFYVHTSLVMSGDGSRCPLGIIRMQPFVHRSELQDEASVQYWQGQGGLYANESSRWKEGIVQSEALLDKETKAIHVADRECDIYEVICDAEANRRSYVLRANQDRAVAGSQDATVRYVSEAMAQLPWLPMKRCVVISARTANRTEKDKKTHPPRAQREVELSFRAAQLVLKRPRDCPASSGLPASEATNVVEVCELNPPLGEEPIRWLLMTSEPIAEPEQILQVVDDYRGRWPIEEVFKGAKTGCRLQDRQAESADVLLKITALTTPIAAHLLLLRYFQRHQADQPATIVFTSQQINILKADPTCRLHEPQPTVGRAVAAVARLGGHRKNNGDPGWLVLSRGHARLLEREIGWYLAMAAMKQNTGVDQRCVE
jgi:hypothetical protein